MKTLYLYDRRELRLECEYSDRERPGCPEMSARLDYYLIESRRETAAYSRERGRFENIAVLCYGFGVSKSDGHGHEERYIEDVTSDPVYARRILKLLADGLVTPFGLVETLEEILAAEPPAGAAAANRHARARQSRMTSCSYRFRALSSNVNAAPRAARLQPRDTTETT